MKLDVLVTTAHPDDAEFSMGGTILKLLAAGKKVGIADFTRGELGTNGSADMRTRESAEADRRFGLTTRVNLGFRDGFFTYDETHVMAAVTLLRTYRPDILFTNPAVDRHPDHGRAHAVMRDAVFLSGLEKIKTDNLAPWRPKHVFHYIQNDAHTPDLVVDITPQWDAKLHVLGAYESQFNGSDFWEFHAGRARTTGAMAGVQFGEGFLTPTGRAALFDPIMLL